MDPWTFYTIVTLALSAFGLFCALMLHLTEKYEKQNKNNPANK